MRRSLIAMTLAALGFGLLAGPVAAAKPDLDPSYANGKTVYMIGPHVLTNPGAGVLAHAEELYLVVYPINPDGRTDLGLLTLPSGYRPQCDPCFHPGNPLEFAYHDHVLTGAPGMGANGTAGVFEAPWRIIVLMYDPTVIASPSFQPVKSAAQLDWAETQGWFLPINDAPGAANPFEIDTGTILICPITSSHA
jgi:hypothetical protein